MKGAKQKIMEIQIAKTIENLKQNNMSAYYVHSKNQVKDMVASLMHQGDTVAVGGSETLSQTGVLEMLRNGKYRFLDRYNPDLDDEQRRQIFIDSFSADVYLTSSNAVTMKGELYNVDGNSNRVAAICFGPKSVIMVVGCNKIVPDINAAITYVIAAFISGTILLQPTTIITDLGPKHIAATRLLFPSTLYSSPFIVTAFEEVRYTSAEKLSINI